MPPESKEERAAAYDGFIRQIIPGYELLHSLAESLLSVELSDSASLLIGGSGTGMEIIDWGSRHPGWRFTAVEPNPAMTEEARRKVGEAGFDSRVRWHSGPLETLDAAEPFDAATYLLIMHFIADDGAKLALFEHIADRLKPGAPLLLAHSFGDPETTRYKKLSSAWKARTASQGLAGPQVEELFDPKRPDLHVVSEERQKSLLREAGFIDVQRFFQAFLIGGWIARTNR